MLTAHSYISKKAIVLHEDTPIQLVARAMVEKNIGSVLVCNAKGHLIGIVTDRDIACAFAVGTMSSQNNISEVMTPRPITVEETTEIHRVIELMQESNIRRIPVVKRIELGINKCVGIITLDDLVASKVIDYDQLAIIIRNQIHIHSHGNNSPSKRRAENRSEHTLNRFHKVLSGNAPIPVELVPQVTLFLLECLVKRIHYAGAVHFIAQLPKGIQTDLLEIQSGPDRHITPQFMIQNLHSTFGISEDVGESILFGFFSSLELVVNPSEIDNIKAQLPSGFRALFEGYPKSKAA